MRQLNYYYKTSKTRKASNLLHWNVLLQKKYYQIFSLLKRVEKRQKVVFKL